MGPGAGKRDVEVIAAKLGGKASMRLCHISWFYLLLLSSWREPS